MAIGGLVAVPELQAEGPARLEGQTSGYLQVRFLTSGAEMTVEARTVVRYALLPGTRVTVDIAGGEEPGEILDQPPRTDQATGLIWYPIRCDNGIDEDVAESGIVEVVPPETPQEQLRTASFHELQPRFAHAGTPRPPEPWGPQTYCARQGVLAWRDRGWTDTGGVIALAGARVIPLPHQLLAARRILADRRVRFLLADEVGLGKTIEAGLVVQSLLATEPHLRVLIVVPGALSSQWFLELYVKFGGRRFTMLDGQRLADYNGNPWSEQFLIVSSRALEELKGKDALRFATSKWDVVIVDECHRMQPDGILYKRLATLSKKSPHVLLLSATPARQHADAYLALLHLLQPDAYPIDDIEGFQLKLQHSGAVADLLADSRADEADAGKLAKAWIKLLGEDKELVNHAKAWAGGGDQELENLAAYVREHYQLDHRVIRNRRQVLAQLSAETGIHGLELGERSLRIITYKTDEHEDAVRTALADYRNGLLAAHADEDTIPPRLAHWLLQLELAVAAHPRVLDRLLAMRAAVLEAPEEAAEYRARARPEETIGTVLRSDLSEAEGASHIAVSASCFADPDIDGDLLSDLQAAIAPWLKRVPARSRRLGEQLKKFWGEFPQEKVLVFTGHAIGVQELAEYLSSRFGHHQIATFGAHQDPMEREEAATRFRTDDDCWLMVSDALGGEGRNFQFVSLVVHHDLPWSIAAIEQRIGRVDRLGRDGEVPSLVLVADHEEAIDAAWTRVVDSGVGVFTASSSGLEFVADQFETKALETALRDGAPGLDAAAEELAELVSVERDAREDKEAELFRESQAVFSQAAELAQKVSDAHVPISHCCRWLRGMGGHVRREEDAPRPFSLRGRSADKPIEGVFHRDSALAHEQLSFFARGNELIDRLIDDAVEATWCAASAWRRRPVPACRKWEGVRVTCELVPDYAPLMAAGLPVSVLRRLYTLAATPRVVRHIRCSDGGIETDPEILDHIDRPFDAKVGDSTLSTKTSRECWMRPMLGGKFDQVLGWQQRVDTALASVDKLVADLTASERERIMTALEAPLKAQADLAISQASHAVRMLGGDHVDAERLMLEAADEKAQCDALLKAAAGAEMAVAGVAYVIVA